MNCEEYKKCVGDLNNLLAVQGSAGNWDNDGYMCGMFNGMELAVSIMEGREPIYRRLPKKTILERFAKWYKLKTMKPIAEPCKREIVVC